MTKKIEKLWLCLSFNKVFLGWVGGKDLRAAKSSLSACEQGMSVFDEPVFFLVEAGETDCIQVKPDDSHTASFSGLIPRKPK